MQRAMLRDQAKCSALIGDTRRCNKSHGNDIRNRPCAALGQAPLDQVAAVGRQRNGAMIETLPTTCLIRRLAQRLPMRWEPLRSEPELSGGRKRFRLHLTRT